VVVTQMIGNPVSDPDEPRDAVFENHRAGRAGSYYGSHMLISVQHEPITTTKRLTREHFIRMRASFPVWAVVAFGLSMPAVLGGCQAVGFIADTAYRAGDHDVEAKYTGLEDKTFAVVVASDRAVQADYPEAVTIITTEVTRRLAQFAGASGMVTAEDVLKYQAQHPGWVTLSPVDLAKVLSVDRLVYIDLQEYTLTDPGNPYLWSGRVSASIGVAESTSELGMETVFREFVKVKFPDNENTSPQQVPASTIQLALLKRFIDRTSWLFFDHEEPNVIKY